VNEPNQSSLCVVLGRSVSSGAREAATPLYEIVAG
jgi:hypothetical protein